MCINFSVDSHINEKDLDMLKAKRVPRGYAKFQLNWSFTHMDCLNHIYWCVDLVRFALIHVGTLGRYLNCLLVALDSVHTWLNTC